MSRPSTGRVPQEELPERGGHLLGALDVWKMSTACHECQRPVSQARHRFVSVPGGYDPIPRAPQDQRGDGETMKFVEHDFPLSVQVPLRGSVSQSHRRGTSTPQHSSRFLRPSAAATATRYDLDLPLAPRHPRCPRRRIDRDPAVPEGRLRTHCPASRLPASRTSGRTGVTSPS